MGERHRERETLTEYKLLAIAIEAEWLLAALLDLLDHLLQQLLDLLLLLLLVCGGDSV